LFRAALARVAGMIRRPGTTLAGVIAAPRSAGLLVSMTILAAAASGLLMNSEVGQLALVDQWERTALAFGQPVDDARYAELQAGSRYGALYGAVTGAASVGGVVIVAAVLVYLVYGRGPGFGTVLAVVAHSGVILALRQIVAAPIAYARETTASAATLGRWFPLLDESSPVARFLGLIDLFVVWWAVVLAIGVALLYQRRAPPTAAMFVGLYAGVALVLAGAIAVFAGTS
jgi:hypothetical protein